MNDFCESINGSIKIQDIQNNRWEEKKKRLEMWSSKPDLFHHKMISLLLKHRPISRGEFIDILKEKTKITNPYKSVAGMMSDGGNNYGRIFINDDFNNQLIICPELEDTVCKLKWENVN